MTEVQPYGLVFTIRRGKVVRWRMTRDLPLLGPVVSIRAVLRRPRPTRTAARATRSISRIPVDIGPSDATAWLSEHGAEYGLCQIYGNEPWHYELRPEAIDQGCPPMYADPTQDPRMQG